MPAGSILRQSIDCTAWWFVGGLTWPDPKRPSKIQIKYRIAGGSSSTASGCISTDRLFKSFERTRWLLLDDSRTALLSLTATNRKGYENNKSRLCRLPIGSAFLLDTRNVLAWSVGSKPFKMTTLFEWSFYRGQKIFFLYHSSCGNIQNKWHKTTVDKDRLQIEERARLKEGKCSSFPVVSWKLLYQN